MLFAGWGRWKKNDPPETQPDHEDGYLEQYPRVGGRSILPVSVVVTVRNEVRTVGPLLDTLLCQSYLPSEIIVADAGSTDGTADVVRSYGDREVPVRLLVIPGANRGVGRNAAIRAARTEIIACTDAGSLVAPQWLFEITRPMLEDPEVVAVAGHTHAEARSLFEAVQAALLYSLPPRVGNWLPSSRSVAFRRSAWLEVGGYPEDAPGNEDALFALALRRLGTPLAIAPRAIVHWRPRSNIAQLFRQYLLRARADGRARIFGLHYGRKALWYLLALALLLAGQWYWLLWVLLVVAAVVYLARRMLRVLELVSNPMGWLQAPAIIITVDIASVLGYLVGRLQAAPRRTGVAR